MPCDTLTRSEIEEENRQRAFKELEQQLKNKSAEIQVKGSNVNIKGWTTRGNICDVCAINTLRQSDDFEIRRLISSAVPTSQGITFGHHHEH